MSCGNPFVRFWSGCLETFSGFQQDVVMMILTLINAINARKYVTLVPERACGHYIQAVDTCLLNGCYRIYYRKPVHITFYLCPLHSAEHRGNFWASGEVHICCNKKCVVNRGRQ